MKKHIAWFALACSLMTCVPRGFAATENSADLLRQLDAAIRKEDAAKKPKEQVDSREVEFRATAPLVLAQIRAAMGRQNDPSELQRMIGQVSAYYQSEAVREAAEKLQAALVAEQEEKTKAALARFDEALTKAGKAAQEAAKPSDLDAALQSLADFQQRGSRYSPELEKAYDKLRNGRQFLVNWQDYLMERDGGDKQRAIQHLQNASNNCEALMIPRSFVLARIKELSSVPEKAPADFVSDLGLKTLDDVGPAIAKLSRIPPRPGEVRNSPQDFVVSLTSLLNSIQQTYVNFKAGIPTDMAISLKKINGFPVNGEAEAIVAPLRADLMRLTFPRFLGVEEKPRHEESIQAYLDRVMAKASQSMNAKLIARVYELKNRLDGRVDPVPPVLNTLIAAQNQDEAGQFIPAVISYQSVLKTGGDLVPVKEIGARLDAIKAAHPADYEKGLQLFLAQPEPSAGFGRSGFQQYQESFGTTIRVPGN